MVEDVEMTPELSAAAEEVKGEAAQEIAIEQF